MTERVEGLASGMQEELQAVQDEMQADDPEPTVKDKPSPRMSDPEPLPPHDSQPGLGLGSIDWNPGFTIERPYNPYNITKDPLHWYLMAWVNFMKTFGVSKRNKTKN